MLMNMFLKASASIHKSIINLPIKTGFPNLTQVLNAFIKQFSNANQPNAKTVLSCSVWFLAFISRDGLKRNDLLCISIGLV